MVVGALDLLSLDRDVARAADRLARSRAELRRGDRDPEQLLADPLASFRHVAGRNAYEALAGYPAALSEEPVRAGLLSWVHALTEARVGFDLEEGWERESQARRGRVLLETPQETSYREAWRGAAWARDGSTRQLWLEAAAEEAPRLAPLAREASERRIEVAKRLGLEGSAAARASAIPLGALEDAARTLLVKTADLREALRRESEGSRTVETPHARLSAWIDDALAIDAADGWPARLTRRWFEESFREVSRGAHL
jgi:hypothetical protein